MRESIRRVTVAALAMALVSVLAAPVTACDGEAKGDAQTASNGK